MCPISRRMNLVLNQLSSSPFLLGNPSPRDYENCLPISIPTPGYVLPHENKLINIFKVSVVMGSQGVEHEADFSKKRESKLAPFMFVGHRGQRTSL